MALALALVLGMALGIGDDFAARVAAQPTDPTDPTPAAQPETSGENGADAAGMSIADLIAGLSEPDVAKWQAIEQAMLERHADADLRTALVEAARSAHPVRSQRATRMLRIFARAIDPELASNHPDLFADYFSSNPDRRARALVALWRERTPAAAAMLRERAIDRRETIELRRFAVTSLAVFPPSRRTVATVMEVATQEGEQLAPAALWVLAFFDRRTAEIRAARQIPQLPGLGDLARFASASAGVVPALARPIADEWALAVEPWKRATAWRYLARYPHTLTLDAIRDALIAGSETDTSVRAVIATVMPHSPDWPIAPTARLAAVRPFVELLGSEPFGSREALQAALERLVNGPLAARFAVDESLPPAVRIRLPDSFWLAAANFERPAINGLAMAADFALMRRARRALVAIGDGAALLARLPVGDTLAGPYDPMRNVFAKLSRRLGIEVMAAAEFPYLDATDVPGWLQGGTVYDLLAALGERLDWRFAFDGDRLRVIGAGLGVGGERWMPRLEVSPDLRERYNRELVPELPADFGGAQHTLDDVMRVCAEMLDVPVIRSASVTSSGVLDLDAPRLAPGKPLITALPAVLDALGHGLKSVWRGRSLWIVTNSDLAAWESLDRYRSRPTPDTLDRLAGNALLNRRPVVAELLALLPPATDAALCAPWVAVARNQIARDAAASVHPARRALAVAALQNLAASDDAIALALDMLADREPDVRHAARRVLAGIDRDRLWAVVAPHLVRVPTGARLELVDLLGTSVTAERLQDLLAELIARTALLRANPLLARRETADLLRARLDRFLVAEGFPIAEIGLSFVRLAGRIGITRPLAEMPAGVPVSYEFDYATPDWFAVAAEVASGRHFVTGLVLRQSWQPGGAHENFMFAVTNPGQPTPEHLPVALRHIARQSLAASPMILDARWFPGTRVNGDEFRSEIVIESAGVRNEMETFAIYLNVLARFEWEPEALGIGGRQVVANLAEIRRELAHAAWRLTISRGVELAAQWAALRPSTSEQLLGHPRDEWPVVDKLWWRRVVETLRLLEGASFTAPDREVARLGLRLRTMAGLPIPGFYAPYAALAVDSEWLNPGGTGLPAPENKR